ncbi:MAG TPA: hypothetical protein DEB10_04230, partial [Ruminococcaceae bacterium]|nr:hypothetical protein [Oscillospiraceae bacterium]
ERIRKAENKGDERIRAAQTVMQRTIDSKDEEILAAHRQAYAAAEKLRRQANNIDHIVGRLPLEMRVRFFEERDKVAAINGAKNKSQKERG